MAEVDDVLRVACRQQYAGVDDQVNVMHWVIGAMPTPATDASIMADIADLISEAFQTIDQYISDNVDAVDMAFYNVTQDEPVGVVAWGGGYSGGTGTGEALPTHDTALVLLPTSVKRRIGRIYLPTMTEGAQGSGAWVAGVVTAVDAFGSYLTTAQVGGVFGGTYRYTVYGRSDGSQSWPTLVRLAPRVAVQRRRKRGRGS